MNRGQVVISEVPYTMQATAVYVQILANSLLVTSFNRITLHTRNNTVFVLLGYCEAVIGS